MKALLQRALGLLANEPVVVTAGVIQSGLVWLFTYVVTGWNPSEHQQQLAGIATGAAVLLSLVARQFVTPAKATVKIHADVSDLQAVPPPTK